MGLRRVAGEPEPGDHLLVFRGGYTHHGVYVGAGRVAHKVAGSGVSGVVLSSADAALRSDAGSVVLTDLAGFCPEARGADDWSRVRVVLYRERFSGEDAVALALSQAALSKGRYRLLESNCEHFATLCVTGEHTSGQVVAARALANRFGALATGLLAGCAVAARLEANTRVTTQTVVHRGRGVRGALGLGRRRVVVTEETVDGRAVLRQAGLAGLAAALASSLLARALGTLAARGAYRFAVRLDRGGGGGGGDAAVAVGGDVSAEAAAPAVALLPVRRGQLRRGLAALRAVACAALGVSPPAGELWRHGGAAPLAERDLLRLPHTASLRLVLAQ